MFDNFYDSSHQKDYLTSDGKCSRSSHDTKFKISFGELSWTKSEVRKKSKVS
jgi:hypothetical protein